MAQSVSFEVVDQIGKSWGHDGTLVDSGGRVPADNKRSLYLGQKNEKKQRVWSGTSRCTTVLYNLKVIIEVELVHEVQAKLEPEFHCSLGGVFSLRPIGEINH